MAEVAAEDMEQKCECETDYGAKLAQMDSDSRLLRFSLQYLVRQRNTSIRHTSTSGNHWKGVGMERYLGCSTSRTRSLRRRDNT